MGRTKGTKNGEGKKDACDFCEGTKYHWGKECGACDKQGFDLVACELDQKYYESALKRLKIHQSQTTLF